MALIYFVRDVRYKSFAALGPADASWEYARLDEFLLNSPLFWHVLKKFGVIPPLHVLNEKLGEGAYDAGMSGASEWRPFQLSDEEYEELVEHLLSHPEHTIVQDRELWSQPDFEKWFGALLSKYAGDCDEKT